MEVIMNNSAFRKLGIIIASAFALASSNSYSATVVINGQKLKSYDEMSDYYYGIFNTYMSNSIASNTISRLQLSKLDGKFLFVSPELQTFKERYVWVSGGLVKPSDDTQLMIAYGEKLRTEMIWFFFERMGLVGQFDVINESSYNDAVARNYDYVVTMRSDYDGKRDAKTLNGRKTEFFVRKVKTGSEQKITESIGSPVLVGMQDGVAAKFSDAVKAAK
jgi:hypothetical protein